MSLHRAVCGVIVRCGHSVRSEKWLNAWVLWLCLGEIKGVHQTDKMVFYVAVH
jgi:hypothetical protein